MTAIIVHMSERKLLKLSEAAIYVGLSIAKFHSWCGVSPIVIAGIEKRFHVDDLDHWIEQQKNASSIGEEDVILAKLK